MYKLVFTLYPSTIVIPMVELLPTAKKETTSAGAVSSMIKLLTFTKKGLMDVVNGKLL